ncbi:MAG: hypothetical protein NTW19_09120 [Planctomycetota bacterium]|nr:hypothetical protein [Planctomycetota bacterium]
MKLKNINIVERHVERVFLGLAVLFAAAVLWLYYASSPYSTPEVGPERAASPDRVEEVLEEAAKKLSAGLNSQVASLPPMPVPTYTQDFQRRVNRSVAGVNRYDVSIGQPALDKTLIQEDPPPPLYEVPTPPAPREPRPTTNHYVLADPADEASKQSYIALIGAQQPRDFHAVSVMASFDMDAWRQRIRSVNEKARVPDDWFRATALVTDVVLERETQDPVTGAWGARIQIQPLPNATSFRSVPPVFSALEAQQVLNSIKADPASLQRPNFANVTDARPWSPPGTQNELSEDDRRKLAPILDEIDKLQKEIEKLKAVANQPAKPGARAGGTASAADNAQAQIPRLQERLNERRKEQASIINAALKGNVAGRAVAGIGVWAHDLSVRFGQTYRYRVYVAVLNPLFHKPQLHPDQRKEFFNKLSLYSEPSAWTAPITIDQETYYFLVNALAANQSATVEVWRIFNGAWHPQDFVVQAGDTIGKVVSLTAGASPFPVDYRLNALAVDVDMAAPARAGLNTTTARLLVLPGSSDKIIPRILEDDREDPIRARLRAEAAAASPVP